MAELKTRPEPGDVGEYLESVPDPRRRDDAKEVCALMQEVTGLEPVLWGPSMVGFGSYAYKYSSGRSGEWFAVGFAPRKADLVLYLMDESDPPNDPDPPRDPDPPDPDTR